MSTHNVRVSADEMKEPWFVAKGVAEVMGYKNTHKAIIDHCKGANETLVPSAGGLQMTKIIGRDDIIRLVMKSKLPFTENHLPKM